MVFVNGRWLNRPALLTHVPCPCNPRGAINDLAVHPTGKLALSVGRDKELRIWNLMAGRCAYITHRPVGASAGPRLHCPFCGLSCISAELFCSLLPSVFSHSLFFFPPPPPTEPTLVGWLPSGDGYFIGAGKNVHVYATATSELAGTCALSARVMRITPLSVRLRPSLFLCASIQRLGSHAEESNTCLSLPCSSHCSLVLPPSPLPL